jgi:SsrA-binding protein
MPRQATHQTKPTPEKSPRREPTAAGQKDAAVNRIASHNYFLLEKFEAGVALTGTEVKSIRTGLANLKDAYGLVKDNEIFLLNAHIGPSSAPTSTATFTTTLRCAPASCSCTAKRSAS